MRHFHLVERELQLYWRDQTSLHERRAGFADAPLQENSGRSACLRRLMDIDLHIRKSCLRDEVIKPVRDRVIDLPDRAESVPKVAECIECSRGYACRGRQIAVLDHQQSSRFQNAPHLAQTAL